MSVLRQANLLGQQRLDIPHLRAIESSIAADFDLLAGNIMAGQNPFVVQGFNLIPLSAGSAAATLQIQVANGVVMHPEASESGTIFVVAAGRTPETLNAANARVSGGFTASAVNYVGIDLRRTADATTVDLVQFLDADNNIEQPKSVPLARTLDYVIIISAQDFSTTPGVAPLCKVTTDASNNVVTLEDARNLFGRLGTGGSITNPKASYPWPGGRGEVGNNSDFGAGDKAITCLKDWMNAAMSRIWEVGGGEYWYSATADRNVKLLRTGAPFTASGDWFTWDGTNLLWKGLAVIFDNSTGTSNVIKDQTTTSAGLTNLADGECIYVDLDRTQNRTSGSPLIPVKAQLSTLSVGVVPGSRWVIAWRFGSGTTCIVTRDAQFPVNANFTVATTAASGLVRLSTTPGSPTNPVVFNPDANGALTVAATGANTTAITATGGTGNALGILAQGVGTGAGIQAIGGATNAPGVLGKGAGAGAGVDATGGATGSAVIARSSGTNTLPTVCVNDAAGNTRTYNDWIGFPGGHLGRFHENWLSATTSGLTVTSGDLTSALNAIWNWTGHAATGDTVAMGGTAPGINSINSPQMAFTGGTVSGSYQSLSTRSYIVAPNAQFAFVAEWEISTNGGTRSDIYMGWINSFPLTAMPTTGNKVIGVGVRNTDTNWQLITGSGTGAPTYTDSGVVYTAGTNKFRLEVVGSGASLGTYSARLYINGTLNPITTTTTTMPPSSTPLAWEFLEVSHGAMHLGPGSSGGISGLDIYWNRMVFNDPVY